MILNRGFATGVILSVGIMAAGPASADIVNDIIRDAVKDAIKDEIREEVTTPAKRRIIIRRGTTSRADATQRSINQETQTSLNYFGFQAGTPDGVLGRRSRRAVSEYQSHMGYSRTGKLDEYERDFLVSSYYRAVAGDQTVPGLTPIDPYGARDLLYTYRDQPEGGTGDYQDASSGTGDFGTDQDSGLPTFMAGETPQSALSLHCNQVNLKTNANGGFVTAATLSDPGFALEEQFCLARTYAIAKGEELAATVEGVSNAQLEAECASFGPTMQEYVSALSLMPRQQVMQDASEFVLSTGMAPSQLGGTAKVCLSVGYRTDNLEVALGSALMLSALGEAAYGELLGHHLTQGFGTSRRPDLGLEWYQSSVSAMNGGATKVFAPDDAGRNELILQAALQLNGQDQNAVSASSGQSKSNSGLPMFSVGSDSRE